MTKLEDIIETDIGTIEIWSQDEFEYYPPYIKIKEDDNNE